MRSRVRQGRVLSFRSDAVVGSGTVVSDVPEGQFEGLSAAVSARAAVLARASRRLCAAPARTTPLACQPDDGFLKGGRFQSR